jgi:hypothetical protein
VKFSRILIVALAVAAIAAPTASAMPIRGPIEPASPAQQPEAQWGLRASVAEALAKEREAKQQLSPTNPSATVAGDDGGIDWPTIAIGVGLTFVALGAITGVNRRIRSKQRPRVA